MINIFAINHIKRINNLFFSFRFFLFILFYLILKRDEGTRALYSHHQELKEKKIKFKSDQLISTSISSFLLQTPNRYLSDDDDGVFILFLFLCLFWRRKKSFLFLFDARDGRKSKPKRNV